MIKKEFFFIIAVVFYIKNIGAMSREIIQKIGNQIRHNETGGLDEYLVFWSVKESFPSLGISHAIWLPEEHDIQYTQIFPLLCDYLKKHSITLPVWLEESLKKGAPWKNREDFCNDHQRKNELCQLLVATIDLQTSFMIDRLKERLPKIIEAAPIDRQEKISQYINSMKKSPRGMYILVDYLNFKGDGLNPKEESNGQRWGMLSVLLDMPDNLTSENVIKAFTVSAAKKLLMLIEHDYRRIDFLGGWMNRLNTYVKDDILS